jgi:hypothetical protein
VDPELAPDSPTRQRWRDDAGCQRDALIGVFDLGNGWACRLHLERFGEAWGIAGVLVQPAVDLIPGHRDRPTRPLTSAQLKALRTRPMISQLRAHLLHHPDARRLPDDLKRIGRSAPGASAQEREYALVAARYLELVESQSPRPNVELAEELGDGWDAARVRDWLHRARVRGLLTRTRRGVPGGELTDRARALIADEEN